MSAIDVLREIEWAGTCPHTGADQCMSCHSTKAEGHAPDCRLAAALREPDPVDWRARYEALLDRLDAADRPQESARSVARRLVPDRADHPKSAMLFEAIAAEIAKRDSTWLQLVAAERADEREACAEVVAMYLAGAECSPNGAERAKAARVILEAIRARGSR